MEGNYPIYATSTANRLAVSSAVNMEAKLDEMLAEVRESRKERKELEARLEEKFLLSMSGLKQEVNAAQKRAACQFSKQIGLSTYDFRRKGNETQFKFNCGIESAIDAAKVELTNIKPADNESKEALKKAESSLDEGNKEIAVRQKHIKIADRSDLRWATVKHDMADLLADGPEDEKDIARSEKEARKEHEQAQAKKGTKQGVVAEGREGQGRTTLGMQGMSLIWIMAGGSRGMLSQGMYPRGSSGNICWGHVSNVAHMVTCRQIVQHHHQGRILYSLW